jgi:hypothetical protein
LGDSLATEPVAAAAERFVTLSPRALDTDPDFFKEVTCTDNTTQKLTTAALDGHNSA